MEQSLKKQVPHSETLDIFLKLDEMEPSSMHGQPKIIWHRAQDCHVYDEFGNEFIDFTSGVLIANCGHNHPKVNAAIRAVLDQGLLTSYIFVNKHRVKLLENILRHVPAGMDQVLLFCSGSEAIEASIKLAKNYAKKNHSSAKKYILSFNGSFHGRTLGAQLAGGIPALKDWIEERDTNFLQVPYPDADIPDTCDFEKFTESIQDQGVSPNEISCLVFETYQGGVVKFAPTDFMKKLRQWCDDNAISFIADEVQAGFGRTGKWWGFEHYGITPDIIASGKGISSSLPVSAVIGRRDIMNQFSPGAMSTTHSGNPLCSAAAAANIEVMEEENLVQNAADMGNILQAEMQALANLYPSVIKSVYGKGLVCGIHFLHAADALKAVNLCVEDGLMLFNPVGSSGATVKFNPPLTIDEALLVKGISIFAKVLKENF